MTYLFFLLFPLLLHAHIIQDDVSVTDTLTFSYSFVCQKMFTHDSPLIDAVSGTQLDCMGKKLEVAEFCDKEMVQDPYYLRAYVDKKNKQVVCQSGKKVIFKYLCVKISDKHLCDSPPMKSCQRIKIKLANRLDIVHASVVKNEKGIPQLNCFFESLPLSEKPNGRM